MPGAGTSPVTTTARPQARLLDVTRLISRAGSGALTGIDRVELAYLTHLLERPEPLFVIARTALGFILLDRAGAGAMARRISGARPWGEADWLSRRMRLPEGRRRAESDLRRLRLARCTPRGLKRMLARHCPADISYLNVGHSNLNARMLGAVPRVAVMIHDTIPLDHPEFTRPGVPEQFARKLRAVGRHADLVIYNSQASRAAAEARFAGWGRVPRGVVAPLGVEPLRPDPAALPAALDLTRPYFVTLGTIEPRKDHALLLDVWQQFHDTRPEAEIPRLFIVGHRGWNNAAVFARLDSAPFMNCTVFELPDLSDGAMAALLQGARALLFPSRAEGYGLPPLEAVDLGTPAIVANLPIYRETLGDFPVYVANRDAYLWAQTIERFAKEGQATGAEGRPEIPAWEQHFQTVLGLG
ncbi:glycosyltransferase family 1 protein [Actibacterium sp. MT2.3-13A]|uniref:glycosyltransferase family 4 protein n=1 Tax=Actibacterium sp. MT2.3-13A TaxID=2828332 RepID=UPI001BA85939|nr:glycosyltransferase family 1 protein [Actibacterium sp. MT2.3-13A]